jgi:hypothetical protein
VSSALPGATAPHRVPVLVTLSGHRALSLKHHGELILNARPSPLSTAHAKLRPHARSRAPVPLQRTRWLGPSHAGPACSLMGCEAGSVLMLQDESGKPASPMSWVVRLTFGPLRRIQSIFNFQ